MLCAFAVLLLARQHNALKLGGNVFCHIFVTWQQNRRRKSNVENDFF